MKEYKRLTERKAGNYIDVICEHCEYNKNCLTSYLCVMAVKKRLAELEDKIENGILIELKEQDNDR